MERDFKRPGGCIVSQPIRPFDERDVGKGILKPELP
jgi:hypothetical protein